MFLFSECSFNLNICSDLLPYFWNCINYQTYLVVVIFIVLIIETKILSSLKKIKSSENFLKTQILSQDYLNFKYIF